MLKKLSILILGMVLCFMAGFALSIQLHGDWLLVRNGGMCQAWDPLQVEVAGSWNLSSDGKCHMSVFIWHKLIGG